MWHLAGHNSAIGAGFCQPTLWRFGRSGREPGSVRASVAAGNRAGGPSRQFSRAAERAATRHGRARGKTSASATPIARTGKPFAPALTEWGVANGLVGPFTCLGYSLFGSHKDRRCSFRHPASEQRSLATVRCSRKRRYLACSMENFAHSKANSVQTKASFGRCMGYSEHSMGSSVLSIALLLDFPLH